MAQKMVGAVGDWAWVKHALDLGCDDRGILLNAVALQLKKAGSSGRVVGLHPAGTRSLAALRNACMEGVQEYVTCRAGDPRRVPFGDGAFDVVVSAAFVHKVLVNKRMLNSDKVLYDLWSDGIAVIRIAVKKCADAVDDEKTFSDCRFLNVLPEFARALKDDDEPGTFEARKRRCGDVVMRRKLTGVMRLKGGIDGGSKCGFSNMSIGGQAKEEVATLNQKGRKKCALLDKKQDDSTRVRQDVREGNGYLARFQLDCRFYVRYGCK
nr:S-adenosyl-L-methionine-dependent methyltransferases superfamily protein [Ipomoea batatas]